MPGLSPVGERYRILWVTPEVEGLAGSGPAARVSAWLPRALAALGHRVRVVMPRYRGVPFRRTLGDFAVPVGDRRATAVLRQDVLGRPGEGSYRPVPVFLVDNYQYLDRDDLYGYPDDGERFAFFCLAVVELVRLAGWRVDVLHLHDWPAGPLALLQRLAPQLAGERPAAGVVRIREAAGPLGFPLPARCVFTFYAADRQGNFDRGVLHALGLPDRYFHPEELELYGRVSFLKAGLLYADGLATVSRAYARDIQHPPHGHGLEGLFRKLAGRLTGIVNGIDTVDCDPSRDPRIYRPFTAQDLRARSYNKAALLQELGLAPNGVAPLASVALAAYVGELSRRQGAELLLAALPGLLQRRVKLVVVGAGEPFLEQAFLEAARRHPGQLAVALGFNTVVMRRAYAGADLALVPALDAPDASSQLVALRYGAVPVVRAAGALADTIFDYEADAGLGNGFSFRGNTPEDFLHAVDRALDTFRQRELWERLVCSAMACDYSWHRTAVEYMGLYAQAQAQADRGAGRWASPAERARETGQVALAAAARTVSPT